MLLNIQLPSIHTHSHSHSYSDWDSDWDSVSESDADPDTESESEQTTRAHKSTPTQKFRISLCSTYERGGEEELRGGGARRSWVVLCTCLDMLMRSRSSAIITTNAAAFPTHLVSFFMEWEGKRLPCQVERMKRKNERNKEHFKAYRRGVEQNKLRN